MKINVFTFTRDRLTYTKICFNSLQACQKYHRFNHYVLDNGSADGTQIYLTSNADKFKGLILSPSNLGLHKSCEMLSTLIDPCDLVIKADNDCFFNNVETISNIAKAYKTLCDAGKKLSILSPTVKGIVNQPKRGTPFTLTTKDKVSYQYHPTGQIGGICMAIPYDLFKLLVYNTSLPMAKGLDSNICQQGILHDYSLYYFDDTVTHYDTTPLQAKRYPAYFVRKRNEEKIPWKKD